MKISILTDIHANLPALEAALTTIQHEGCDVIYQTGDLLGIGPFPAECLDIIVSSSVIFSVQGNHERFYTQGLPSPQPEWMSDGEVEHQHWTHAQIDPQRKPAVTAWPLVRQEQVYGVRLAFLHFAPAETALGFAAIPAELTAETLDRLFEPFPADLVFYGHTHIFSDLQGRARYINPGSLGCFRAPVARFTTVELEEGKYIVRHHQVAYEDAPLYKAFEQRRVPEREFLYKAFFGGRF